MTRSRMTVAGLAAAFCTLSAAAPVLADYPERPVRIVVGYAPGGGADIMARILADQLSKDLGQSFIVENKPGAATTLAASVVSSAPGDGYTIMLTTLGTAISSYTLQNLPYDYSKDLRGIAMIATNDFAVIVPKDSNINSMEDLVRIGRAEGLSYSSSGINSPSHLIASELTQALQIEGNHVPYSGSGEAMTALMSGEVDLNLSVTANAAPAIRDALVKGVGITSLSGNAQVPDLTPVADSGLPAYEAVTWYGMVAPSAMPDEITETLNAAIGRVLEVPDVRKKLEDFGYTIKFASPEEFQAYSLSEVDRWTKAAAAAVE